MSKPLPEEILKRIKTEAEDAYQATDYYKPLGQNMWHKAYAAAAESYCTQYLAEKERADQLERWKAEAREVMDPLLDWGKKNAPLGVRIHQFVLDRLAEADKYEKVLLAAKAALAIGSSWYAERLINEALSTQTDNKTEDNGPTM